MSRILPLLKRIIPKTPQGAKGTGCRHKFTTKRTGSEYLHSYYVAFERHGEPTDVLFDRYEPVKSPLGPNDVLVDMLVAPISSYDVDMITGKYFINPPLPTVAGNEGVGQVLAKGREVWRFRVGDWVVPTSIGAGTWRTKGVMDETHLMQVPTDIPVMGAAMLCVNPCTAYRILKTYKDLRPSDAIIQNGPNSGIGQAIIQLAREWGLTTINIVRSGIDDESVIKFLKDIGGTHVITDTFVMSEEMDFFINSLPCRPRLAVNFLGGAIWDEMQYFIAEDAVLVTYGDLAPFEYIGVNDPRKKLETHPHKKVHGYWGTTWDTLHGNAPPIRAMLREICDMMREGRFVPPPCEIYKLDMYQMAIKAAREPLRSHKVVFKLADDLLL